jgi:long-chain acyl-CoA synthetase
MTLEFHALFDKAVSTADPRQPFLVVDGVQTTYAQITDLIARYYTIFSQRGIGPGTHVGILTRSPRDVAAIMLAALRSGISVINLNVDLSPVERRLAITSARLSHIFVDRDILDQASLPGQLEVMALDPSQGPAAGAGLMGRMFGRKTQTEAPTGFAAELAAAAPGTPVGIPDPEATALMLFTSGTTSQPKVVQLSHRNLAAQLQTFFKVYGYGPDARILNPLPLHFTDGLLHGPLITFMTGATLLRPRVFDFQQIEDMLLSVYRDRITHMILVPALLAMIDRLHGRFHDAFDAPDFRYIRSSGDRLPQQLWEAVQNRFSVQIFNTYGLSETVCEALYCGPAQDRFRLGSIGKPVDCAVRIVDDDGRDVATGEVGELLISGDNIMKGYLDQPALTAETIVDGWLHTGDFAQIDPDGFVTIVGRKKTLIISGGINIQPQDIVDALLEHPSVSEAHAVGLPDRTFGEIVACACVPAAGFGTDTLDEQALIDFLRDRIAPAKLPRAIIAVEKLPRNPAGKVLGDEVAALFKGKSKAIDASETLEKQVIAVAAGVLSRPASELSMASDSRNTLGWDSLAHMALISAVETHFDITLSTRDILGIARLEHLMRAVQRNLEAR